MEQSELEALASRIDQLIERNRQLSAENARLRQAQGSDDAGEPA